MPPNTIIQPADEGADLADLRRRIERLERSSPLMNAAVSDNNGVIRFRLGAPFADDGSYGFRVYDASGNLIYSSAVGVMSQPAGSVHDDVFSTTNSTTYSQVTNAALTWTIPRRQTFLFMGTSACNLIGGAPGNWGYVIFNIDGVNYSNEAAMYFSLGAQVTNGMILYSVSLPAGSHTVALYHRVDDPTVTIQNFARSLFAFQLGG